MKTQVTQSGPEQRPIPTPRSGAASDGLEATQKGPRPPPPPPSEEEGLRSEAAWKKRGDAKAEQEKSFEGI